MNHVCRSQRLLARAAGAAALLALSACAIESSDDDPSLDEGEFIAAPVSASATHNWGAVDPNMYRGDYAGRRRAPGDDPNTAITLVANPDMSTRELEALINDAPPRAQISFTPGRFVLTEPLDILRGDVTIRGSGPDETVLDVSARVFEDFNAVKVRPPAVDGFGSFSVRRGESKAVIRTTGAVRPDATRATFQDARAVEPGDFLFFLIVRSSPNVRIQADRFYNAMVEVAAVDGNSVTFRHKVGIDYNPRAAGVQLAEVHVLDRDTHMLSNVIFADMTIDYGTPRETPNLHRHYNHNDRYFDNELSGDGVRGLVFTNTYESDIERVTVRNAGANGILVANSMDAYVTDFVFDGAQNLGGGGAGYGLQLFNSYYGTFENLRTTEAPVRHFVTYHAAGTGAFNNVHVTYTNANIDFHGGPDHSNIYYVETAELPQKDDFAFPIIEYRDPVNEPTNTVVFDVAVAAGDGLIDYNPIRYGPSFAFDGENNGHRYAVDGRAAPRKNRVYASNNGAQIVVSSEDDAVHSGEGDDVFVLGGGADVAHFYPRSGVDVIRDFDVYADKLAFQRNINGLSADNPGAFLERASQEGDTVRFDLGGGASVVLERAQLTNISAKNIIVF